MQLFFSFNSDRMCTGREARTPDTWFWRPVLYQLSYTRIRFASANIVISFSQPRENNTGSGKFFGFIAVCKCSLVIAITIAIVNCQTAITCGCE